MVALSDLSREGLVRELRTAIASGNYERAKRIKRELAKRHKGMQTVEQITTVAKPRSYVDD